MPRRFESGAHVLERPHVVRAIGELDEQDADVLRHRHDHLAEVLRLLLLLRVPGGELRELRHAVDEVGDLGPEELRDVLLRREGVLDRVVQEAGDDRRLVEAHLGEQARHLERVDEVRLPGLADLALVDLRGVDVGLLDQIQVGVRVIPTHAIQDVIEAKQGPTKKPIRRLGGRQAYAIL
jgi:hypothetical protein